VLSKKPPKHLSEDAHAFFSQVIAEFDITDAAGLALLLTACEALDRMSAARRVIEADGEITEDRYGQKKVHPACQLERDSRNGFLAAMRALQLDIGPTLPVGRPTTPLGWTGRKT
jgi:P27 family predicted phage terminase small subunit